MKNIILSLLLVLVVSSCSSGTTVADTPFNITGTFTGTFDNTPNTQDGTLQLNLFEDDSGNVSGTAIFDSDGSNCLLNGVVDGSTSSFNVTLEVDQEGTVTTLETTESEDSDGVVTIDSEYVTTDVSATLTFILTQSNNGNRLSGTYLSVGETCSNSTGSGTVSLSR